MKTCTRCKQAKPETEFFKRGMSKDGIRSECKACTPFRNGTKINRKLELTRRGIDFRLYYN
jgi:hypothetical protein